MTPEEHYREAEKLLQMAEAVPTTIPNTTVEWGKLFEAAQVHATLALFRPSPAEREKPARDDDPVED